MPPTNNELGQALAAQREACGLSQSQVAVALNRTPAQIDEFEAGDRRPTPGLLERLSALLEYDFVSEFPAPGTTEAELRDPENYGYRLRHLCQQLSTGNQRAFARLLDMPESVLRAAMTTHRPLAEEYQRQLERALPSLRPDWLLLGEGEPFRPGTEIHNGRRLRRVRD